MHGICDKCKYYNICGNTKNTTTILIYCPVFIKKEDNEK